MARTSKEQEREVSAPLDYSPAYVRDGAVIPLVLGASMELMDVMPENREKGILIAPPVESRDNFTFMDENTRIEMVSRRMSDREFEVEITAGNKYDPGCNVKGKNIDIMNVFVPKALWR